MSLLAKERVVLSQDVIHITWQQSFPRPATTRNPQKSTSQDAFILQADLSFECLGFCICISLDSVLVTFTISDRCASGKRNKHIGLL